MQTASTAGRRYLVTRHPGAVDWAARQGIAYDLHVPHIDPDTLVAGDLVIGTVPVHLAARLCARGVRYWHLVLDVEPAGRGREYTAAELEAMGARLEAYTVARVTPEQELPCTR